MITETLRAAVIDSDKTRYRLSVDSGISQSVLSRFVSGERDLTLSSASKIAAALGLDLIAKKRTR
jgi:transcriptional regulator with XRE-family HTH domain